MLLNGRSTQSVDINALLPSGLATYGTITLTGDKGIVIRNDTSKTSAYVMPLPGSSVVK